MKNQARRKKRPAPLSPGTGAIANGERPSHFFQKQLAGEEPLRWATAERLYVLASHILALAPWNFLADSEIFLLSDPHSGETCYCSVMGALGEVFSLHAYIGTESYRLFRFVESGGQFASAGEFLATQKGVSVEFVRLSELTPPDRELLKCFGHPLTRDSIAPVFRALRPGFHPWHVTESEANTLAECMEALLGFSNICAESGRALYWEKEDVYPMLTPTGNPGPNRKYALELVRAPEPPPTPPQAPVLNEEQVRRMRAQDYAIRGCFEVDSFYPPGAVGGKNERKACVCVGLVTEAGSGFVFHPEVAAPAQSSAPVLAGSLIKAIETARFLPAEVLVRKEEFKTYLAPFTQQLGIPVRVADSLPALERARDSLINMMFK